MIEYTWRVMKDNRFAGYVLAMSMYDAQRKAEEFYGKGTWVERIREARVSQPKVPNNALPIVSVWKFA